MTTINTRLVHARNNIKLESTSDNVLTRDQLYLEFMRYRSYFERIATDWMQSVPNNFGLDEALDYVTDQFVDYLHKGSHDNLLPLDEAERKSLMINFVRQKGVDFIRYASRKVRSPNGNAKVLSESQSRFSFARHLAVPVDRTTDWTPPADRTTEEKAELIKEILAKNPPSLTPVLARTLRVILEHRPSNYKELTMRLSSLTTKTVKEDSVRWTVSELRRRMPKILAEIGETLEASK